MTQKSKRSQILVSNEPLYISEFGDVSAYMTKTVSQTIPDSVNTAITFNAELFDTDTLHDNVTNNTRITIPAGKAGKYVIIADVAWSFPAAPAGAYFLKAMIRTGASNIIGTNMVTKETVYSLETQQVAAVYDFGEFDYIEVVAYQTSGDTIDVTNSSRVRLFKIS